MKKLSLLLTALAVFAVSEVSARETLQLNQGTTGARSNFRKAVVQKNAGVRHLTKKAVVAVKDEIQDFAGFDAWAQEYSDECIQGKYSVIFNSQSTEEMFDDAVQTMTAQQYADSLVDEHIAFLRAFAKNTALDIVEAGDRVVTDGIAEVRGFAAEYNKSVRGEVISKDDRKSVAQQFAEEYLKSVGDLQNIYNPGDIVHFILDNANVKRDFKY